MKKGILLRSSIHIILVILLVVGGNAKAFTQLAIHFPNILDGTEESPSPATPPPSTTEPPPPTTEPPPQSDTGAGCELI